MTVRSKQGRESLSDSCIEQVPHIVPPSVAGLGDAFS